METTDLNQKGDLNHKNWFKSIKINVFFLNLVELEPVISEIRKSINFESNHKPEPKPFYIKVNYMVLVYSLNWMYFMTTQNI